MQIMLENRRKVVVDFSRSSLKKKKKVEEGGALGSGVKRE